MSNITQAIIKAKDFLNRGSEDYAILSIIEALEILAAPEPDTENLGNRLTAALQENAMLNGIWRAADKENDRLRGFVEKFLTVTTPKNDGSIDLPDSKLWELIREAGEIRGEIK